MSNHSTKRSYCSAVSKKAAVLLLVILSSFSVNASTLKDEDCGAPTLLTVESKGTSHIIFTWTVPETLPANGYTWEIRTSGDPGSGADGFIQSGTTTSPEATALNLLPETSYTLAVRSSCSDGINSEWAVVSFFTDPLIKHEYGQIGDGIASGFSLYGPILYTGPIAPRSGSVSNMLYTSEEVDAAGIPENALITGVGFNKLTNATGEGHDPVKMRILAANSTTTAPLSITTTLADVEATHTEVLTDTAYTLPALVGWIDFNFSQSFEYTGDNLEIATAMYYNPASDATHFSTVVSWEYTTGFRDYVIGAWPISSMVDINNSAAVILNHGNPSGQFKERANIRIYYDLSAIIETVAINTPANTAAAITENQGTLQLAPTVTPSSASQDVNWVIVSGSEYASIDRNGLISAFANGVIVIRAVSMDDATIYGDISITITNQAPCNVAFPGRAEPITSVVFGGINNTSSAVLGGATPVYEDYTSVVTEVTQGESYTLTVKGNTGGNFNHHINTYIDWNRNNSFEDEGEAYVVGNIQNSNGLDNVTASASITIPADGLTGNIRMRIIKKFNSDALPCNTLGYGQAEDYTLNVNEVNMGIGDQDQNKVAVYPNPFTDTIQLRTTENITTVEAFNYLGQSVGKATGNEINLASLSSGIYILRIDFQNGSSAAVKVLKK